VLAAFPVAAAARGHAAQQVPEDHSAHQAAEDHSAHMAEMARPRHYTRTVERYALPALSLLDQDGAAVDLQKLLAEPRPIALDFIFTTCTTICPIQTATLAAMNRQLGDDRGDLLLVSVSIDPEYDTPEVLADYARKWTAGPEWRFLTGSLDDVVAAQKAFDAFAGAKTNHRALTFFKASGSDEWVRIDGLATAQDLAREYRELQPR